MTDAPNKTVKLKLKNSEALISATIDAQTFDKYLEQVVEDARKEFSYSGFRKGHVPREIFDAQVPKSSLLENAAERALNESYPEILKDQELHPITPPEINITKIAEGNPLEFTIKIGVRPEIKLPDYKKIGQKTADQSTEPEVTEEEMEELISRVLSMHQNKDGDKKPELTDELVKTLGNFKNVDDFEEQLRKNMVAEKQVEEKRQLRETMAERLVEASNIHLPQILIDQEVARMKEDMKDAAEKNGKTLEEYLNSSGKTEEEIEKEHRNYIERQLKTRFIFEEIAKKEGIKVREGELYSQVAMLQKRYPDLAVGDLQSYAITLILNEKVLRFLEGKLDPKEEGQERSKKDGGQEK